MLKYFFEKLFPFKTKQEDIDPISYYYNKMESINCKYKDDEVAKSYVYRFAQTISDDLVNSCLERAIERNNFPLVKLLHPYLNLDEKLQKNKYLKYQKSNRVNEHNNLFHYAIIAMENNRPVIFSYLMIYHCQHNHGNGYPYNKDSVDNFHYLINSMFQKKSIDCFHILRKFSLFSSTQFLEDIINFRNKPTEIEDKLNFVIDNLYDRNKSPAYFCGERIEPSKLLFDSLCNFIRNETYNEKEYTDSCINVIGKLLSIKAAFYYEEGPNKWEIGGKEFFDMMTYLVDNDKDRKLDINVVATNCAQMKDNFNLIEYFLKKGAVINHHLPNIEPQVHSMIKKWNDAKKLHSELDRELIVKRTVKTPKKINKV